MTASDLYADSQGLPNVGRFECHWCASPCSPVWQHDEAPRGIGPNKSTSRRPASPWICNGCWLWARRRITVSFVGGGFKDGQAPFRHSWWVAGPEALAVHPDNRGALYPRLLDPPGRFFLYLNGDPLCNSRLHLATANDLAVVKADTPLRFSLNDVHHEYTVYELEQALRNGPEGKGPGVRALVGHLGPFALPERERGRPKKGDGPNDPRRVERAVFLSGCMSGATA